MTGDCYKARLELETADPAIIPRLVEDLDRILGRRCGRPAEGPSWRVYTCGHTMVSMAASIPEPGLFIMHSSKITILVESRDPDFLRSVLDDVSRVISVGYHRIVSVQLRL